MEKIKSRLSEILLLVSAFIILGALYIWAPVCTNLLELKSGNMVHMKCFYVSQAATYLAILMIALVIDGMIIKKKPIITPIIMGIVLFVMVIETPVSIGICKMSTMACHTSAIWLKISAVLSIIAGIVSVSKKK